MECDNNKHEETSNLIIIINRIKIIKIQCSFYVRVCVCRKYSYCQFNKNMICLPVCACVYVRKVYWINVSIVGRSKEDKKLTLLTYMCMHVFIYVKDHKYGPFVFLSPHVCFLWSLATMCCVLVVSTRMLHAFLLCVLCMMPSAVCSCFW